MTRSAALIRIVTGSKKRGRPLVAPHRCGGVKRTDESARRIGNAWAKQAAL
jgi:hypothetical protein